MAKTCIIDGVKYKTFYNLKNMKPGQVVFILYKHENKLVKTTLVEKPLNFKSLFDMGRNEKFLFQADDRIIEIIKHSPEAERLTEKVSFGPGFRYVPVSFFQLFDGAEEKVISLSKKQKEILNKMNMGEEYSPASLGATVQTMAALVRYEFVKDVSPDNIRKNYQIYEKKYVKIKGL